MTVESIMVVLDYNETATRADARIANVIPISVKREGTGYYSSNGAAPGNLQYRYNSGAGQMEFEIAGTQPVDANAERVFVKYKY